MKDAIEIVRGLAILFVFCVGAALFSYTVAQTTVGIIRLLGGTV